MRSIGAKNIKKLKAIIKEEAMKKDLFGDYPTPQALEEAIDARIPAEWYSLWEMAYQEIEGIKGDFMWAVRFDYKANQ